MTIVILVIVTGIMFTIGYFARVWAAVIFSAVGITILVEYQNGVVNAFSFVVVVIAIVAMVIGNKVRLARDFARFRQEESWREVAYGLRRVGIDPYRPLRKEER